MKWFDNTALTLVIVGAVNWLLVGIFRFDLVAFLFGNLSWFSRIVYAIVGLCGLYLISLYGRIGSTPVYFLIKSAIVINKGVSCYEKGCPLLFAFRNPLDQRSHILIQDFLCPGTHDDRDIWISAVRFIQ